MAHVNSDAASFRLDDATGSIAIISGSVNSLTMDGGQALLDDTGLGDTRHTVVAGLANATTVTCNGWLDSTSEAIFAPLLDGTSITKTIGVELITGSYWNGEAWPEAVSFSANIDALQTWSCTFRASNGLTSTSVAAT